MNEILIRITAQMDALLLPESGEQPGYDTVQNRRFQHIEQYRRYGLPWRPSLLDPGRDAKQAERDLTFLVNAGDLETPATRRREFVRLTRRAHARARLLMGWEATIDHACDVLIKMHKARKQAIIWNGVPWLPISTNSILGRAAILFALGHGWIQAELDYHSNPVFSITDHGYATLKSGMVEAVEAQAVKSLRDLYEKAYKASREAVSTLPLLNPHDMHVTGITPLYTSARTLRGSVSDDEGEPKSTASRRGKP